MTLTTQHLTLSEYLNQIKDTDISYELVKGELTPMALGTGRHGEIGKRLVQIFDRESDHASNEWTALQGIVGVQSPKRERWDTVRIPDVLIIPKSQWKQLQNREAIIGLEDSPPLLVVEIVSPSTTSTDYRAKRSEYCVLEIPEYWIVDPLENKITVLTLSEGWYDAAEFTGSDRLISATYPDFPLNAIQLLQGEI